MKQLTLILLICIYGLATLGLGINQFYCCGKLKSTNISLAHEAKQKCPSENDKDRCCKTKYQSIKIKDNHVAADIVIAPAKHFSDHYFTGPSFEPTKVISQLRSFANASHAPPLNNKVPIYTFNCVYRI